MSRRREPLTDDIPSIRKAVIRGFRNQEFKRVTLAALKHVEEHPEIGIKIKLTRKGILFLGPGGPAGTHFTPSEYRGLRNYRANLRRMNLPVDQEES